MKLTIKVTKKEERSIISLIKMIDKATCKVNFDVEDGLISIQTENGKLIDELIDAIESNYDIKRLEIDNTDEDQINKPEQAVNEVNNGNAAVENVADLTGINIDPEEQKINDEYERFLNTYHTICNNGATYTDAIKFLKTAKIEMLLNFSNKKNAEFSIGDIVECYYGIHLPMEINGAHVSALICDIIEDMAYVVPITKATGEKVYSQSYIEFKVPDDVIYTTELASGEYYKGGTILLDKGRYIHVKRINAVLGRAEKFFFKEVTHFLTRTMNFEDNVIVYGDEEDDDDYIDVEAVEVISDTDNVDIVKADVEESSAESDINDTSEIVVEKVVSEDTETTDNVAEMDKSEEKPLKQDKTESLDVPKKRKLNYSPKPGTGEAGVYEFFTNAIYNLDSKKPAHKQAISFMKEIGMDSKDKMLVEAFSSAGYVKTITYESIAEKISETIDCNTSKIVFHLKVTFQKWLKSNSELKEKYPRISFVSFLKVFAKEIS